MIVKLLGFFDLLTAATLFLLHLDFVGWKVPVVAIIYLMLKAIIFFGDIMSILDAVTGVYIIILLIFGFHSHLTYLFIIYLFFKAIFSFL